MSVSVSTENPERELPGLEIQKRARGVGARESLRERAGEKRREKTKRTIISGGELKSSYKVSEFPFMITYKRVL